MEEIGWPATLEIEQASHSTVQDARRGASHPRAGQRARVMSAQASGPSVISPTVLLLALCAVLAIWAASSGGSPVLLVPPPITRWAHRRLRAKARGVLGLCSPDERLPSHENATASAQDQLIRPHAGVCYCAGARASILRCPTPSSAQTACRRGSGPTGP